MFAGWLWCRERIWRRQHQQKTHATASTSAHLPETTHWSLYSYVSLFDCWLLVYDYKYTWSRMMKFKLREAMRSGKISPEMFDTDAGTRRQNLFLKNQRKQRRLMSIQFALLSKPGFTCVAHMKISDTTSWCWARRVRTIARWKPGLRGRSPPSTTRERWGLSSTSFLPTFSLRFFFNFFCKIFFEVYLERCEFRDGGGESLSDCADRNLWGKRTQCSMWWRRFFQTIFLLSKTITITITQLLFKTYFYFSIQV